MTDPSASGVLEKVHPDDRDEVSAWLSRAYEECDDNCIDNDRIALVGDETAEAAYQSAVDSGCCGFWDGEVECKSGRVYLCGFNYGH